MEGQKELTNLLNASGFAFQTAVENQIKACGDIGWLTTRERNWEDAASSGFIDLVAERADRRVVIECKRTKNATWLFLAPETNSPAGNRFRLLWRAPVGGRDRTRWGEVELLCQSEESQFCNVRGGGETSPSMLDRIASELVKATEALAGADYALLQPADGGQRLYIPMIITNATLVVARFDPDKLCLKTGMIGEAEYKAVDFVRYRKTLGTATPRAADQPLANPQANDEDQRSIIVLNAGRLRGFFESFDIGPRPGYAGFPWEIERRRAAETGSDQGD